MHFLKDLGVDLPESYGEIRLKLDDIQLKFEVSETKILNPKLATLIASTGTLYLTDQFVIWKNGNEGLLFDYLSIMLHSLRSNEEIPYLYCHVDEEQVEVVDEEDGIIPVYERVKGEAHQDQDDEEGDDEGDPVEKFTEISFIPKDKETDMLNAFEVFCNCAELHVDDESCASEAEPRSDEDESDEYESRNCCTFVPNQCCSVESESSGDDDCCENDKSCCKRSKCGDS